MFWPAWTAAAGYLAERVPSQAFESDDALTRLRHFEHDGDWYRDCLLIHAWKDRIPEAGAVFGGFAKRNIQGSDADELIEFVVECRRAEYAHWVMSSGVVLTYLWNPRWAFPVNAAVAAGSNLPCIAVQRYNRARLNRTIARMRARSPGQSQ